MRKIYIISAMFLSLFLGSCGNFLEEYSQDLTYARTAKDLDELLVGSGYMEVQNAGSRLPALGSESSYFFPWLYVIDDDAEIDFEYNNDSRECLMNFYLWGEYPYTHQEEVVKDDSWKRMYKHISVVNVILDKASTINDLPEELDRIKGECHFLRASFYYFLVNFYAKPYSKTTASKELGVPIKLTEFIEDIYFRRNSVEEVYALILSDLTKAVELLKGKRMKSVYRANYYAAQAFMSRICLYMEDYDGVIAATDEVLKGSYSLLDYNGLGDFVNEDETISTNYKDSPETIFSQGGNAIDRSGGIMYRNYFKTSPDLLELYDEANDLRKKYYFYNDWAKTKTYPCKIKDVREGIVSSNFLLRLPEVLLNRAEALAMKDRWGEAKALLNDLRAKRIAKADYYPVPAADGKETIDFIRNERRRELCFEGQRWFDLRRYAVNTKYPFTKEIVHDTYIYDANLFMVVYAGSVKLNKYGSEPAYVLPIPKHVIEYNRGQIVDNEIRPARQIFNK